MPTSSPHFKGELQDLLDQRLDADTRAQVERHLTDCAECQREFAALRWTKNFAAERFAAAETPENLTESIVSALRAERSPESSVVIRPNVWPARRGVVLAWAAMLVVGAIVAASYFLTRPSLPQALARNFEAYEKNTLVLESETRDVRQMEIYFDEHHIPFRTRVFDLAMMDYHLVGGRVQRLRGRESALFVYRGPGNHPLLCQMYPGTVADLPEGAVRREHNGIPFYRYQINGLTVVFWPEGGIMCALVSDIAPEKVLDLAFAKAAPI